MKKLLIIVGYCLLLALNGVAQTFESATEAVKNMKVGWNLGNTLDSHGSGVSGSPTNFETYWGQPVTTAALMKMMHEAGFNAIRVPVTWYQHMDRNNQVDAEWMKRVHEVVDYVVSEGMYCILNVHHDTGAHDAAWLVADEAVYAQQKARYESLWTQIAEEFRDYDDHLLFEAYNEMLDVKRSWCFASFNTSGRYDAAIATSAYNAINSYAQSFVNAVRATGGNNTQRNLVVCTYGACSGGGTWNSHLKDPLQMLNMPQDVTPGHIAFEVHSYPNVENMQSVKDEVDDMVNALNTHLASKGTPVIFGEWGTANVDNGSDYSDRRANVLEFAHYFVKKAKENGFATFYWMGLSDAQARMVPVFNQPDVAESILKGWHGDDYVAKLPTYDDYEYQYTVVLYSGQWQELNLYTGSALNISQYTGLRLEMAEPTAEGLLNIKVYGASDGKESFMAVTDLTTNVTFDRSAMGTQVRRVTLQYQKAGSQEFKVVRAVLLKADGTEEETKLSPFWGCRVTDIVLKPKGDESNIVSTAVDTSRQKQEGWWTLDGRRLRTAPASPGVYLHEGRKVVFR